MDSEAAVLSQARNKLKHLAHIIGAHARLASGTGAVVRMCRCDLCRYASKELDKNRGSHQKNTP